MHTTPPRALHNYSSLIPYNLLFPPTHFINALPLLKQTLPPYTLLTNLTSSHPPFIVPVLQISVTSFAPGNTGLANLA